MQVSNYIREVIFALNSQCAGYVIRLDKIVLLKVKVNR